MRRIFIGGTGRSGTTILKKVLTQHPDIAGIPVELRLHVVNGGLIDLAESLSFRWTRTGGNAALHQFRRLSEYFSTRGRANLPVIWRLFRRFGWKHGRPANRQLVLRFLRRFNWMPAHPQSRLDEHFGTEYFEARDSLIEDFCLRRSGTQHPDVPESTMSGVTESFYETRRQSKSRLYRRCGAFLDELYERNWNTVAWCDDTPLNVFQVDKISSLFDGKNVKFVHIMRHPADVVASWLHLDGSGWTTNSFNSTLRTLSSLIESILCEVDNMENEVHYIRLEDLASMTEDTVERLFGYLGLDISQKVYNISVDPSRVHRASKDLTKEEIQKVWVKTSEFYSRFGYTKSGYKENYLK